MTQQAEVTHGCSHLIIESPSIGLIIRYIISNYEKIKLDFGESIMLSENGCLDELYF